ncbi:MAG: ABC transporter substrate-binding protein [Cyanosarcina radialis HA8281-LM2]|jgi:iron complex transport system substrate-binding protein|nr:ABC transporter substrate-binding protein [Cyanosarcina radialis HA8281-LM2]
MAILGVVRKIKGWLRFYWLSGLTLILLSACQHHVTNHPISLSFATAAQPCRVVKHEMGETCIPLNPKRVVTLNPATFANCWILGIEPIGSADEIGAPLPDYLQGQVEPAEFIGSYDAPNLEKILQLKPDLILSNSNMKAIYQQLAQIAPTVELNTPFPPIGWKYELQELARFLDKEEVSQQLIERYEQRIDRLKQALGERDRNLKVSVAATGEGILWAYGQKHYSGTILEDLGLQRPRSQTGDIFYVENLSEETLADIDGDVLFFMLWGNRSQTTLEKLRRRPLWQWLNAVRRDRVYIVGEHWHESDIYAINAILDDLEKYLVDTP